MTTKEMKTLNFGGSDTYQIIDDTALHSKDITSSYSASGTDPVNGQAIASALSNYVPTSRTINSKALSSNITLSASDVGALPDNTTIPTITDTYSATSSNGMSGKAVASALSNSGFISGITSSDVTNALGYTPYNGATNPNGYTSNTGTVTSVNNVSPVNGNVTLSIPSEVTETTVSGWGFTKNAGTVTSVNNVSPSNGNVTLSIPTTTDSVTSGSSAALTSGGAYTALSNKADSSTITTQSITTLSNGTIALASNCSMYKHTPSAATTYTFNTSNLSISSSVAYTFELYVNMSTVYTLTFPSSLTWQDGETPDMSSTGTYFFAFRTIDGGSTWKGNLQGVW